MFRVIPIGWLGLIGKCRSIFLGSHTVPVQRADVVDVKFFVDVSLCNPKLSL